MLATGDADATVRIWDVADGAAQAVLFGHTGWVYAVAAFPGPGGRTLLATGGGDGTVRIWDAFTGTETGMPTLGMPVYGIAPIESGLAVAVSEGVVVMDLHPAILLAERWVPEGHRHVPAGPSPPCHLPPLIRVASAVLDR